MTQLFEWDVVVKPYQSDSDIDVDVDVDVVIDKVSANKVDVDGNCAIHYAASNGLNECVKRLLDLGAIISIVNRNNHTCCELADLNQYKELSDMLELALVFQPDDSSMWEFTRVLSPLDSEPGQLIKEAFSVSTSNFYDYMELAVKMLAMRMVPLEGGVYSEARAESLLSGKKRINDI